VRILFIIEDDAERIQLLGIYATNPCDVNVGERLLYLDIRVQLWTFNSTFRFANKELVKDFLPCFIIATESDYWRTWPWTVNGNVERSVLSSLVPIEFDKQSICFCVFNVRRNDIAISLMRIFQTISEAAHHVGHFIFQCIHIGFKSSNYSSKLAVLV
jgi:hypothetical protein